MAEVESSVAVAAVRKFSVMRKGSEEVYKVLYIVHASDTGTVFVCADSLNKLQLITPDQVDEVRKVEA